MTILPLLYKINFDYILSGMLSYYSSHFLRRISYWHQCGARICSSFTFKILNEFLGILLQIVLLLCQYWLMMSEQHDRRQWVKMSFYFWLIKEKKCNLFLLCYHSMVKVSLTKSLGFWILIGALINSLYLNKLCVDLMWHLT